MSRFEFKDAIVTNNDGTLTIDAKSSRYSPMYEEFCKDVIVEIEDGIATVNYNRITNRLTFDEIPVTDEELDVNYRTQDCYKRRFTFFGLLSPYYVKGWYRGMENGKDKLTHREVITNNFKIIQ